VRDSPTASIARCRKLPARMAIQIRRDEERNEARARRASTSVRRCFRLSMGLLGLRVARGRRPAYLQGSQVRPPGQSSSVRTSHSTGEHTHERALATASDSTTMPPRRSNGALILLSSLSTAPSRICFLLCRPLRRPPDLVSPRLRTAQDEDVHRDQSMPS